MFVLASGLRLSASCYERGKELSVLQKKNFRRTEPLFFFYSDELRWRLLKRMMFSEPL